MKNGFKLLILSSLISMGALAQTKKAPVFKVPHSHQSMHNGLLLMFGDSHLELTKADAGKGLLVFLSDKLRDPLKASDFDLEVVAAGKGKRTKLEFTSNAANPSELRATLPPDLGADAELDVKALRLKGPKGEVATDRRQQVSLSKVPEMMPMDHGGAHGGH